MTYCKRLVLILPGLPLGHSVAPVLFPKPSRGLVIGSLISVMTCLKMDCLILKMTCLMSKRTCHKSSIWVQRRLPLLQPGQSVALVLSFKPIAALRRLKEQDLTERDRHCGAMQALQVGGMQGQRDKALLAGARWY